VLLSLETAVDQPNAIGRVVVPTNSKSHWIGGTGRRDDVVSTMYQSRRFYPRRQ
jgi:hypothetical protein